MVSSAIKRDNPELVAAREKRLPVVRRAEMLAELMRLKSCVAIAGTHGKTTTTSMVAALLDAGDFDPTVINGGIINAYGTNARLGAGDWMVVEADESDGTFLKLPADVAIVTNIDAEHLDHFKTFAAVQDAFRAFVENVPFYGFAVMCTDHPIVQRAGRPHRGPPHHHLRRESAGRRAAGRSRPRRRPLDIHACCSATATARPSTPSRISTLPMPGRHNALNATSAIAVAHELGISDDAIRKALAGFGGVQAALHPRRRMERRRRSSTTTAIIRSRSPPCCKAARESTKGQVIAVVQPHRYTRLQSLFEPFSTCFNDADAVIVAEVYAAGEAPIEGIDRDHLVAGDARARPSPGDPAAGPAGSSPAS